METKIITPAEARALAEKHYPVLVEVVIESISKKIEKAAKRAESSVTVSFAEIPDPIHTDTLMQRFIDAGYCVTQEEDARFHKGFYKISW